jgi:uncharacterized YceG family protein
MVGRRNIEPDRERTSAERAAAAQERARRRAEEAAAPPPLPVREPVREPEPEPVTVAAAAPRREAPPRPAPAPAPAPRPAPPPRRAPRARPVPPRRPLTPAARQPTRGGRRALAVVALVGGAIVLWLVYSIFQPFHGDATGAVQVTVPAGADVGSVGDDLQSKGVIDDSTFFGINATVTGRRSKLKPGRYTLQQGMTYGAALDVLVQGPKAAKVAKTFKVTIPEGRSRRETVPIVRKAGVKGDYLKATASSAALRRARTLGLPKGTRTLEGFLFPATYDLVTGSKAPDLVSKQLGAFEDNFAQVDMKAAKRRKLTRYDVLIIASMVEREAQLAKERPLIAAVIHNRLRIGMPLFIDATIRYAENNWTQPLRMSELKRPGPYNTRLNRGLPPTPIGNPGVSSLEAAARPANVDYLFYVVKPGTCGEHAFSSTDAQFQQDVARYNAARDRAGGKSPTTC